MEELREKRKEKSDRELRDMDSGAVMAEVEGVGWRRRSTQRGYMVTGKVE